MIKLYPGSCFDIFNQISSASVACILVDLPYGVTACKWDARLPFTLLWSAYERILKPNGVVLFTATQPFATDIINSNRSKFKYVWYWEKNQGTNFFHASRMPIRKIEEILVFYSSQPTYNPQMSDGHTPTNSAKGISSGTVYGGSNTRDSIGGKTTRFPTNILRFNCVSNYARLHPNQKPVELFEYLIKTYTNTGDTVLDNCMGSGTTAIACLKTGRSFIGIEKDANFYEKASKRVATWPLLTKTRNNE